MAVRNILEVSSVATYHNTALPINCLSGFNISYAQIGNFVKISSQKIKERQESDSRYDAQTVKKQVLVLYLEDNGVMIKGTQGRLEIHSYQVCEGLRNVTYKRRKQTNAKKFVSLSRLDALNQAKEYIVNTYGLTNTLIISNTDGGAGYAKKDFDEIDGKHENLLDVSYLNKKIKDRLCFVPQNCKVN